MPEVVIPSIPWQQFVAALLIFGVCPGLILRLLVRLYPPGHPRRMELIGELYAMPQWKRPWFVAQQLETALSEGLPARAAPRARAIAQRIRTLRSPRIRGPVPTEPRLVEGYSGTRAADIVGISYRQLDYWARTGLIRPSHGIGSRRRYTYHDLLALKMVKTLLDNGIKLESIRDACSFARDQLGAKLSSDLLVIAGSSAVRVSETGELIDVHRHRGHRWLDLLSLDDAVKQVDAAIVELFPADEAPPPTDGMSHDDTGG